MDRILLLYSGGLDSRLAAKILSERDYPLKAVFFRLPFASQQPSGISFLEEEGIPLEVFDCTRGQLLDDYLGILKHPRYGRGKGYNPCVDCKLFMMEKLGEYGREEEYHAIATGEVPGQRPMSQTSKKMEVIEQEAPLPLIRPLAERGIHGRTRKEQMKLARDYELDYPGPGGGCLLCEKDLASRFRTLIEQERITAATLPLVTLGRHYYMPETGTWYVVGRDKPENDIIETFRQVVTSGKGKPAVYYQPAEEDPEKTKDEAEKLQRAYQMKDQQAIQYYSQWKI
jgi:predicted subunit of tRNA(5-methylaminomethyl-2-thiouridylate) methyltransferase